MSPIPDPQRLKFTHSMIVKSPGLLPMLYTPSELARALGMSASTMRGWLRYGLPYRRQANGRVWIHGKEFAKWLAQQRRTPQPRKLGTNQAYCLRCQQAVEILDPQIRHVAGKLTHTRGTCAQCGQPVYRGANLCSPIPSDS